MSTAAAQARLIGAIFLEWGLVLEQELEDALRTQEATGGRLGEILVAYHGVSRIALASALAEQWCEAESPGSPDRTPVLAPGATFGPETLRRPLGEVLVDLGIITAAQLGEALDVQQTTRERLGEILVRQGTLSRLDLAGALSEHWATVAATHEPSPRTGPGRRRTDSTDVARLTQELVDLRHEVLGLAARVDAPSRPETDDGPDLLRSLARRVEALEEHMRGVDPDTRASAGGA